MARFQFSLQSLLDYREHQRELCRALLSQAIKAHHVLVQQKEAVLLERQETLDLMRDQSQQGVVSIATISGLRYHANRLRGVAIQIDRQLAEAAIQVNQCRSVLVKADQSVKAVEKLRERKLVEFEKQMEAKESREREEIWQANQLRGVG